MPKEERRRRRREEERSRRCPQPRRRRREEEAVVAVRSREDVAVRSSAAVAVGSRQDVAGNSSAAVAVAATKTSPGTPPRRRSACACKEKPEDDRQDHSSSKAGFPIWKVYDVKGSFQNGKGRYSAAKRRRNHHPFPSVARLSRLRRQRKQPASVVRVVSGGNGFTQHFPPPSDVSNPKQQSYELFFRWAARSCGGNGQNHANGGQRRARLAAEFGNVISVDVNQRSRATGALLCSQRCKATGRNGGIPFSRRHENSSPSSAALSTTINDGPDHGDRQEPAASYDVRSSGSSG
nr:hypothetical protein Iba_chr03cCG6030 [Ipomoea batatas]